MKVAVFTLGCKVNKYESEAVATQFVARGHRIVDFDGYADCYIINTCTVTGLSDRKSRQMIRRAANRNSNAVIVAMGCYAQMSPDEAVKIEGVNIVAGTQNRGNICALAEEYIKNRENRNVVADNPADFEELGVNTFNDRTRAFIKIEDGCDNFCSYCIIPYARGRVRSRAEAQILNEARRLADDGFCEVVLTGIHIASYGRDTGTNLIKIIEKIHEINGIERIRVSSLEPGIITGDFVRALSGLDKFCPHLHLSIQSGCDETLSRMNRHYDTEKFLNSIGLIKEHLPNPSVTTDVIVGFPGESEAEFAASYDFIKGVGFSRLHVFPYSARRGTAAASFEWQVPPEVKKRRTDIMLKLNDELSDGFLRSQIGTPARVLIEEKLQDDIYTGFSMNYTRVYIKSARDITGSIVDINLSEENLFFKGGKK